MTTSERSLLVIEILQATEDGNRLYADDSWQVELLATVSGGFLKEQDEELLLVLHQQVVAGDYWYSKEKFMRRFILSRNRSHTDS